MPVAKHKLPCSGWGAEEGAKAKFAVSTWLTLLWLRIPCLLLCLTTAALPVRQEVSSVSCHSPLSCGHFLVFCQCRSVLLTQKTEVVLLTVGSGRTERSLFIISGYKNRLQRYSNVRLPPFFTTFSMMTFLSTQKNSHSHDFCNNYQQRLMC